VATSDPSAGRPEVAAEVEQVKARSQIKKPTEDGNGRKQFSNFCEKKVVGIVEPRVVAELPTCKVKNLDRPGDEKTTQLIRELPKTFREALLEKGAAELVVLTSKNENFGGKSNEFETELELKTGPKQHLTDRISGPEVSTNKRKRELVKML
jgi:hypothetical protein